MKIRTKAAKISFLAVGLFTHLSRGTAAMFPNMESAPPLSPPRDPFPDTLFDKSRLRLAESAEPPLAHVWTGMRQSMPVVEHLDAVTVRIASIAASAAAAEGLAPPVASSAPHITSHQETTKALAAFPTLTPIQRMSIRDYVGESKNEVSELSVNGKELLILRDPKTHEYRGEVTIARASDGNVRVTKLTGATFDTQHSVEIPISERTVEEAEKVLKSEESLKSFEKNAGTLKPDETPGKEISIPAVKIEASAELGPVSEATAVFRPDGSGYEYGRRTNLASASAGAEAAVGGKANGDATAGISAGIGAQALKVELFANYFSKPEADEKGQFTRDVIGASGDAHVTLAELAGKVGCSDEHGCGTGFSLGLLGIGTGMSLNYGAKKVGETSAEGVPEEGIGSTPAQVEAADNVPAQPTPPGVPAPQPGREATAEDAQDQEPGETAAASDEPDTIEPQEQAAYEAAVQDDSVSALKDFLQKYPDSPYAETVRDKEQDAEHPDAPKPADEENKGIY